MSKNRFRLEVADLNYWRRQICCQWGCPVRTDSRGYVIAISEGRYQDAYRIARAPNPFASICGRVCGAPCEAACRRGDVDEPVAIRPLKRFVTEQFGVEAVDPGDTIAYSTARRDGSNPKAGAKIAVIGAGVGGLTAAHDLALLGYSITVFESEPVSGGMLMLGVPVYRLPRDLVQREIDAITSMDVEIRHNTQVGRDVTIPELRAQGYEAIVIAAGLQLSRKINIDGVDLEGVLFGMEFLRDIHLDRNVTIGKRVIVVGGGSVAFDVARSAVRSDSMESITVEMKDFYEAADAARMALRSGGTEIHLVCLESREQMPADELEVTEGVEEGIVLHTSRGPAKIVGENGRFKGLQTSKVISIFDETGRFNPKYSDEPGELIEADTIIFAIGQAADFTFLKDADEINVTPRGIIEADPATMKTNVPDIFACGDVAEGAKLFIDAVASGQKAAVSVDEYLRQKELVVDYEGTNALPYRHVMPEGYCQIDRKEPPVIAADVRSDSLEDVELGYPEKEAQNQGTRCLKCHINTIFHGDKCILCNGCVDVCPMYCLALVPLSEIEITPPLEPLLKARYGVDVKVLLETAGADAVNRLGSVMIKDETLCIRCGFCADRCPTDAVTMEHFSYKVEYRMA